MIVETRKGMILEAYTGKTEFQTEVIRILLVDTFKMHCIVYIGRVEDILIDTKKHIFYTSHKHRVISRKVINPKWNTLMEEMGSPKYLIVYRKKTKTKFVPKTPKLNRDGSVHKTPWKRKSSTQL